MTAATGLCDCGRRTWARGLCNSCYKVHRYRMRAYGRWNPDILVPAIGTERRLQALSAIGWPYRTLAGEIGLTNSRSLLPQLMAGARQHVRASTALRVAEMFDRIYMTPGPSQISRHRAAAKKWPPPLAWDEDSIDDPDGTPVQDEDHRRIGFVDRYNELREIGVPTYQLADRLGITTRSLTRQLDRHSLPIPTGLVALVYAERYAS